MASPVLQTADTVFTASSGVVTTLEVTKCGNLSVGDLIVIVAMNDADNQTTRQISINETGWSSPVEHGTGQSDAHFSVFYKIATSTETAASTFTIDSANSDEMIAWCMRVTGHDSSVPWDGSGSAYALNDPGIGQHTVTGFTPTATETLVFAILAFDGGDGHPHSINSGTSSWTLHDSDQENTDGNTVSGAIAYKTLSSSTASGNCTFDNSANDGAAGIQFAIAAPTSIDRTGTIEQTLAPVTQVMTATADYTTGQVVQGLVTPTQVATGTHLKTYTATAAQDLPALTQAATGTFAVSFTGQIIQSTSAITQVATGTFVPWSATGTISQLLPAVMQSSTGAHSPPVFAGTAVQTGTFLVIFSGPIVQTLAPVTQLSTGTHLKIHAGTAVQTLAPVTQVVTGTHLKTYTATAAQTLAPVTQVATGTFTIGAFTGAIVQTLVPATQVVTGTFGPDTSAGTIAQNIAVLTQVASGTFSAGTSSGTAVQTLPVLTQVVTGTHLKVYSGTAAQALAPLSQVMAGLLIINPVTATVAQTLPVPLQTVSATFAPGVSTGTIAQTLPTVSFVATGTFAPGTSTGSVLQTLPAITQVVTGTHLYAQLGTIAQTLPAVAQVLAGVHHETFVPAETVIWVVPEVESRIFIRDTKTTLYT
jgi:hypothetical protein